jgi:hypothetical protein
MEVAFQCANFVFSSVSILRTEFAENCLCEAAFQGYKESILMKLIVLAFYDKFANLRGNFITSPQCRRATISLVCTT